jgi:hypothetical protein
MTGTSEEERVKPILRCSLSLVAALAAASCAPLVLYSTSVPEVKPVADKSLVVVVCPAPKAKAAYNAEKLSDFFLDGAFCGVTANNTVTQFTVPTGTHYLMARIDNVATVRLNFQPGKVYYLVQVNSSVRVTAPTPGSGAPSGGLTRVQTTLSVAGPDEISELTKAEGLRFIKPGQEKPLASLDPMAKKSHIAAYEFWAKAKPELVKVFDDYPGY